MAGRVLGSVSLRIRERSGDWAGRCFSEARDTLEEDGATEVFGQGVLVGFDGAFNDFDLDGNAGDLLPIDEILAEYGIERTTAVESEVVEIWLDEVERACP